jgi:hypothetical protein
MSITIISLYQGLTPKKIIDTVIQVASSTLNNTVPVAIQEGSVTYIEVMDGCGPYFQGECVNVREGPNVTFPSVVKLRTGVVFRVASTIRDSDGRLWYKIAFTHELLYPERMKGDWYVAEGSYIHEFRNDGDHILEKGVVSTTTKRITVDISEQKIYAYDGDVLFMEESISTGLEFTPTPRGTFEIFKMTPSRFMQGPIPGVSDQVYDLPGVPWNMYFTADGAVIHGAYWHDHFGKPWSHGCVNLPSDKAKKLYEWSTVGTKVTVRQ